MSVKRVLLFVFVLGCSRAADIAADHPAPIASTTATVSANSPPPAPPSTSSDDEDMREAVFRHMFKKNASGMQQSAKVYCLELENSSDPPASFMARFAHDPNTVRAGTGCTKDAGHGVIDKTTKARGLAFRIDAVKYTDKDHATVNGGYFEAGLSASGNVYTVERLKGVWTVTKDEMTWIS